MPTYLDVDAVVRGRVVVRRPGRAPRLRVPVRERRRSREAVTDAGIAWVGPPVAAMEAMARKDAAREIAVAAGVPVVPRPVPTRGAPLPRPGQGRRRRWRQGHAHRPRAGGVRRGGGRPRSARRSSAFGDDTMLVEKYVERGRHIEVQVMADSHGTVLHLWERDCSTQRRHQKVLEEAPAPTISDAVRARDGVRGARWPGRSATPTRAPWSSCSTPTRTRPTSWR